MTPYEIQNAMQAAAVHQAAGRLREAASGYRSVVAAQADHVEALHRLGIVAQQLSQHVSAIACFERVIVLQPNFADAHVNLGNALREAGKRSAAIAAYRSAIKLCPTLAEAHFNLGCVLEEEESLDAALAAYQEAIRLKPAFPQAISNSGDVLKLKGRLDEAIVAYRAAIAFAPSFAIIHNNLGNALKDQGRLDDAMAAYRRAMHLAPGHAGYYSNLVYCMHFHPAYGPREIATELAEWECRHAAPCRSAPPRSIIDSTSDRRLRIGYVSPDFRDHVVGRNVLPLLRQHDRERFEITLYSNVSRPDGMTEQFKNAADHWREITKLSDAAAAQQIREDGIDILVDLALHMAGNRLLIFARKPSPIQATFAGYPGSTGLRAIDYRLSDSQLDPQADASSTGPEQVVRLPHSFWCYDPLDAAEIQTGELPARSNGHLTFGFLGNFCKINNAVLELWACVLNAVADSRLLLLAAPGSHREWTLSFLNDRGVVRDRVEFVPHQSRKNYLTQYRRIDIALDTFPYNGHTTSLDSLWMGVPVVSLIGAQTHSRAGLSQLTNLGLPDLAVPEVDSFVRSAVNLASDIPRLASLRASLRPRMERSPLMDAAKFARSVEAAYDAMWASHSNPMAARP